MATLTIRNLPDPLVKRIKSLAQAKGHSMEQEIRELLETRYAARIEVIHHIQQRWPDLPETTAKEVEMWKNTGR